jgi:hypothetical protein
MRCSVHYEMDIVSSYDELQSQIDSLLSSPRTFEFCIYEVLTDDSVLVKHPNILSQESLLGTDTQFIINLSKFEPFVSNSIDNPSWKDILNIINDALYYLGYNQKDKLKLQGLEMVGISSSGFGYVVQAILS